ncbi:hypothetical protein SLEP1_g50830 [Rubroshorea leprosula]|uniref:Uncharacterized protein n=1 Tax=Rubroshorea leprosula TaxID=152421 RepID=A0AAV5M187_9ROSI|nr:hypothetical protein SLEP1_g50830 [Rubroshorea leprosula]
MVSESPSRDYCIHKVSNSKPFLSRKIRLLLDPIPRCHVLMSCYPYRVFYLNELCRHRLLHTSFD